MSLESLSCTFSPFLLSVNFCILYTLLYMCLSNILQVRKEKKIYIKKVELVNSTTRIQVKEGWVSGLIGENKKIKKGWEEKLIWNRCYETWDEIFMCFNKLKEKESSEKKKDIYMKKILVRYSGKWNEGANLISSFTRTVLPIFTSLYTRFFFNKSIFNHVGIIYTLMGNHTLYFIYYIESHNILIDW